MLVVRSVRRTFRSALMPLSVTSIGVIGIACARASANVAPLVADGLRPGAGAAVVRTGAATDHVVIVSVDGLRPDAISRFKAATMSRLAREGSHSFAATTINPSKTLPSHTSMLTGEGPEDHGIKWNTNETETHSHVAVPTVFALARERGLRTAAFFSKGKFNHLEVPGSLDHTQAPNGDGKWSADRTVSDVERYLDTTRPNLLFVHLGEPDYAGHFWGWMSWMYGRAVRKADAAVARLVAAADRAFGAGNYTFLLTADHGGHGRSHSSNRPENVMIPWIAYGEGVRTGMELPRGIRTMDTAGTALWLLGVDAPDDWTGVPVRDAFTGGARLAADQATSSAPVTLTSAGLGSSGH
jgi:predicted AlkP superfamily pyrophosphatase or phosphodiesterase